MKECIHEALLVGCLVGIGGDDRLGRGLLRLAAEGQLLHGGDLLLLKIYGRHLGGWVLR
jgi:hypothetical protein